MNSWFSIPLLADRNVTFWFPEGASTFSDEVDFLFWSIFWISVVFFVPIVAAMVYFAWKYRDRAGYKGSPEALHNTPLEITWTVVPTFVVIWIFARGTVGYLDMSGIPTANTVDIEVTAQKWNWSFKYPNGAISSELHLPVDRPAKMIMRSQDVIHSLFVPAFRAKCDIVPGRYNYMWFQPTKLAGTATAEELAEAKKDHERLKKESENDDLEWNTEVYGFNEQGERFFDLFCTEYCGDLHSQMGAQVYIHTQEEFDAWVEEEASPPTEDPAEWGKWLYERMGCKGCHSINGSKIVGPSFQGSWGANVKLSTGEQIQFNEEYVSESIVNPQAKAREGYENASAMPSYKGRLNSDEISALIAFMKTLNQE